jgi:Putative prokaryotic signal transducing protein
MRMRLVFEHIDFTVVGHMKSLLDSEGIPCEIRNAGAAGLAGEVPYTQVYPELWVLEKLDEPRAREIIRIYRDKDASAPKGPDWTCKKCGESVDGIYAECWNCSTSAPS